VNKKELKLLSKGQLIELLFAQNERIAELEHRVLAYENAHTPSSKQRKTNTAPTDPNKPRFPGKPEGGNGGGIQMPPPDEEKRITKDACPDCHGDLTRRGTYHFTQMDIPQPKFITTRFTVEYYVCKCCGKEVDAAAQLQKGFYGPKTTAMIATLKNEGLSLEAVARFLQETYKLPITNVAVYNKINALASVLEPERNRILTAIHKSKFIHIDETGFREDGKNGFVWGVSTPTHCAFEYDRSRGAAVAKRLLDGFDGSIVSDDYVGYEWHQKRQLCWSHILREAKDIVDKYFGVDVQAERLKKLYEEAKVAQEKKDKNKFKSLAWELEDIATCYRAAKCPNMFNRLHNRTHLWLRGVLHPEVPLTNNHAERCLRKAVLQRNRMGCIRNQNGRNFLGIILTCTGTWRLQGRNLFEQLLKYSALT